MPMATLQPWIKPLFQTALEEYRSCSTGSDSAAFHSHNFAHSNALSNIHIRPLRKQLRTLKVVQLQTSSGQPEQLGSDGVHAFPLKIPCKKLSPSTPSSSQVPLDVNSILHTDEFEFRISHQFDPPRTELCLLAYSLANSEDVVEHGSPSPLLRLTKDKGIKKLLKGTKRLSTVGSVTKAQEAPAAQSNTPLKSNHGVPEDEGSVVSQVSQIPFQTQAAPFSHPVLDQPRVDQQRQKPAQASRPTVPEINQAHLLDLLKAAQDFQQQRKRSSVPESNDVKDREPHQSPTAEAPEPSTHNQVASSPLTQRPLGEPQSSQLSSSMVLPNSIPSEQQIADPLTDENAKTSEGNLCKEPIQQSVRGDPLRPTSTQHHLRRCREAGVIPGHITKGSKSQIALLESSGCFYGALPGHDFRPPTVPLEILNDRTEKADRLAVVVEKNVEPDLPKADILHRSKSPVLDPNEGDNDTSSNSSQSIPWSQSPEPRPKSVALPPDSPLQSPLDDVEDEFEVPSAAQIPPAISLDNTPSEAQVRSSLPIESTSQHRSSQPHPAISQQPVKDGMYANIEQPKRAESSPQEPLSTAPHQRVNQEATLLVKRSPNSDEEVPSLLSAPPKGVSSEALRESENERIHSTYESAAGQQLPSPKEMSAGTLAQPVVNTKSPVTTEFKQTSIATKRRASDEALEIGPAKRPKLVSRGRGTENIDPDFAQVLQNSRARRSAELSMLAQGNVQAKSSSVASLTSNRNIEGAGSSTGGAPSRRQSRSDQAAGVSTPITVPSVNDPQIDAASKLHWNSSRAGSAKPASDDLFQLYRSTYEDYQGDYKAFDNACMLLQRLRAAQKGPHPSLFDDFIFHHYHSYRNYLQQVAESSDDPLSYARFYDEFIESPTHQSRIIASAFTTCTPRISGLSRESSSFCLKSDKVTHSSEVSLGAHHSASIQAPLVHQPIQEPLREDNDKAHPPNITNPGAEHMDNSQRSSVKSWIAQIRPGSPELGTPDIDRSQEEIIELSSPAPPATAATTTPSISAENPSSSSISLHKKQKKKKGVIHSTSPFTSTPSSSLFALPKKPHRIRWWEDENTPLKQFSDALMKVNSVKRENENNDLMVNEGVGVGVGGAGAGKNRYRVDKPSRSGGKGMDLFAWRG